MSGTLDTWRITRTPAAPAEWVSQKCRQAARHRAALPLSEQVHHPVRRTTGPRILHQLSKVVAMMQELPIEITPFESPGCHLCPDANGARPSPARGGTGSGFRGSILQGDVYG